MTEQHIMTPSGLPDEGYPTTTTAPAGVAAAATGPGPAAGAPPTHWPPPPPPQAPVPAHRPPRRRLVAWFIAAAAAGLVLILVVATVAFLAGRATQPAGQSQTGFGGSGTGGQAPVGPPATAGPGANSAQVSSAAAKVDPGVVDVNTVLGYPNGAAAGTGIVLSRDGLVLTNNHVVSGATSISVTDIGNG
jgi:hypothetical protein